MEAKLMRAVQYARYGGGADNLEDFEVPIPGPKVDEVLLKVQAVSLNPMDWKIQSGVLCPALPRRFPYIPGTDVAGEVVDVGSGVKKFKPGDKVVAMVGRMNGGGLAEFAVVKENLTVTLPSEVSPAEAAALPVAALTAHHALVQSVKKYL